MIEALSHGKIAQTLRELRWSHDIGIDSVAEQAIRSFLSNMPKLEYLEILEPIHSKSMRDNLR